MGQETRNASGLGPEEVSRGLGRGPCELRGLRGIRCWRTWVAMQRGAGRGPPGKMGQETRNALGLGRTRLAGVLDADRLSPGDCAEDGAGGLGPPCNVGAGRGPSGKMGQETRPRWRAGKPWVRRDSSCGGLSPGDHSATRQGWPVGRPQRSRRSERHPAEKATKSPRVPGRTRSVGNRRPGAVMGAQPVPAEWTPRRLEAGAPWVQGPRCRARRAAQSAGVRASDTGGGLGSKESG